MWVKAEEQKANVKRFEFGHPHARPAPDCEADRPRVTVPGNPALLRLAASRRVLLLQGPVGPFFDRLTRWLQDQHIAVNRVVFQGGDRFDCQALDPIEFRDALEQWPGFFESLLERLQIDCVVLFGQARAYHSAAIAIARRHRVAVVVLEEGYIRPGYITMELDGVNGYSTTLKRFVWSPIRDVTHDKTPLVQVAPPATTDHQFRQMAWYACVHYAAMALARRRFAHYRHHRQTSVIYYACYWVGSWFKKIWRTWPDERQVRRVASQPFYFVPLQHDGDAQISHHSPYRANTEFILQVLTSFAQHAPPGSSLVFRQHPQARGGPGHEKLVLSLAKELGVHSRVRYLVEGHTPLLVKRALGVVVINSTVGLQALAHNKALKVMGEALYHAPGLSFQGELHDFWAAVPTPDETVRENAIRQIRYLTQAPCNVYGLADEPLAWSVSVGDNG